MGTFTKDDLVKLGFQKYTTKNNRVVDVDKRKGRINVDVSRLVSLAGENEIFNNYLRTNGDSKRWLVNLETVYKDNGVASSIVSKDDLIRSITKLKETDEFYIALEKAGELAPFEKLDVLVVQRLQSVRHASSLVNDDAEYHIVESGFDEKGNYHFKIDNENRNNPIHCHVPFSDKNKKHELWTKSNFPFKELDNFDRTNDGNMLEISEGFANFMVDNYQSDLNNLLHGRFYSKGTNDSWIGFDNSEGSCYVEEFSDKETCLYWLENSDFEYHTENDYGKVSIKTNGKQTDYKRNDIKEREQ